jgi:cell division septal protein FtsQ
MSHPRRGLPRVPGVAAPSDRRFHRSDVGVERRRGFFRRRALRRALSSVAMVGATAWGLYAVADSSWLTVRRIEVSGHKYLSAGDVEALVDGLQQESVLRTDLERYRQRVLESPWVADVRMSRLLPATIQIGIVERVPVALARVDSQLYLVDGRGSIIDDYGPRYRDFDLPVVDGLVDRGRKDQVSVAGDRADLMAALLDSLSARADLAARVSQIDVSNARDAVVMFDDEPTLVHLGDRDFVGRLVRYVELRPTFVDRFGVLDYADLRFDPQIVVRGRRGDSDRRPGSD